MSELLKRGIIAGLTPRDMRSFDILATQNGQSVGIRVKTKNARWDVWQWVVKRDGAIFRDLVTDRDFVTLVNLGHIGERNEFFVVPTQLIDERLRQDFQEWLETPGAGGRPHNPENKKRHLSWLKHQSWLSQFEDDWERCFRI
jgi:hypothetical protein